jgi:hypothetical protein
MLAKNSLASDFITSATRGLSPVVAGGLPKPAAADVASSGTDELLQPVLLSSSPARINSSGRRRSPAFAANMVCTFRIQ